ncbi:type VII secretion target [Nocardia transvalensis]|uniref:type VII secretion target n=1 Tax=Nocardia transvalensis TaxID=37333 RepID=UPI0018958D02|nr:type VII secretion target [Nocardia transvalensis]MBF6333883.1 hypothetical protein [Nocardia transvalensis]
MAEEFRVEPDDLDKLAGAFRDLAGQAAAASGHATKWFDVSAAETGIYVEVKRIVDQMRQNLEDNYNHLRTLAESSATELGKAAQMYRTTDRASAARLDATYPGVRR